MSAAKQILHNNGKTLLTGLRVHFTVDIVEQPVSELFVQSAGGNMDQDAKGGFICAQELLYVPLLSYRKMYHWFTERRNMTHLRDSYSKICEIEYEGEATLTKFFEPSTVKLKHLGASTNVTSTINVSSKRRRLESTSNYSSDEVALDMAFADAKASEKKRFEDRESRFVVTSTRQKIPLGIEDDIQLIYNHTHYDSSVFNPFYHSDRTSQASVHVTYSR